MLFYIFVALLLSFMLFGTTGYFVRYLIKQAFLHFVAYLAIPFAVLAIAFQ